MKRVSEEGVGGKESAHALRSVERRATSSAQIRVEREEEAHKPASIRQ